MSVLLPVTFVRNGAVVEQVSDTEGRYLKTLIAITQQGQLATNGPVIYTYMYCAQLHSIHVLYVCASAVFVNVYMYVRPEFTFNAHVYTNHYPVYSTKI